MADARRRGYVIASAVVGGTLIGMALWVRAGHGFPGGSVLRRTTGEEGPTGHLTRAMKAMLRGNLAEGRAQNAAAPWMFAYLLAQIAWRGVLVAWRPLPDRIWLADLIASLLLFAAAIYIPWWTR